MPPYGMSSFGGYGSDDDEDQLMQVLLRRLGAIDDGQDDDPNTAMMRYRRHLEDQPVRETGGGAMVKGLLHGMAGWGQKDPVKGAALATELNEAPYRRQVEDWGRRGQGLQAAAQLESLEGSRKDATMKRYFDIVNQREIRDTARQNQERLQGEALSRQRDREEDNRRADKGAQSTEAYRKTQTDLARQRVGVSQAGLENSRNRTNLYKQDVDRRAKGAAPKPPDEAKIQKQAIYDVLLADPSLAKVIGPTGLPTSNRPQDRGLLNRFRDLLERRKKELRAGTITPGAPPMYQVDPMDDDTSSYAPVVGDDDSEYEYLDR